MSSEQLTKTPTPEQMRDFFAYYMEHDEDIKSFLKIYSMLVRSSQGQPIEPEDVFSGLLNIKDERERTRFPSQLDLRRHIYLRTLAVIWPETRAIWETWALEECKNFISFPKGEGRKEGVEIMKAKGMIAHGIQPLFLGEAPTPPPGRFAKIKSKFSRKPEEP